MKPVPRPRGEGALFWLCQLRRSVAGVALTEFALALPILLYLVLGGVELANYVLVYKRVSEITTMVADNAARAAGASGFTDQPIDEGEINEILRGADLQGDKLKLQANSRIILSSLEMSEDGSGRTDGRQFFGWQRCFGDLAAASAYGPEGAGKEGKPLHGVGPENHRVKAQFKGDAVMVAEIFYTYQPVTGFFPLPDLLLNEIAVMQVRAGRDLEKVSNKSDAVISRCQA